MEKTYKCLLAVIITLAVFISQSEAKQLKTWVTKGSTEKAWQESNGWVYAVGSCRFLEDYTSEDFLSYQQKATKKAINQIKTLLNVENVIGFQIIDFEYGGEKTQSQFSDQKLTDYVVYYVLAAAPKDKNPQQVSRKAPPPPHQDTQLEEPPRENIPTIKSDDKNLQLATNTIIRGLTEKNHKVKIDNGQVRFNNKTLAIEVSVDVNPKDQYGFYNAYSTLTITVRNDDKSINVITVQGKAAHINEARARETAIIKAAEKAVAQL